MKRTVKLGSLSPDQKFRLDGTKYRVAEDPYYPLHISNCVYPFVPVSRTKVKGGGYVSYLHSEEEVEVKV